MALVDALIITLIVGITYLIDVSPHRNMMQRIGPYGWVAWISITLNVIIITLIGFYQQ
jgi:hypothetical protein